MPAASGAACCGSFGEPAIKQFVNETMNETLRLENAMRQVRAKRSMVILHYAPIVETIESEPLEIYPFLGSSRLAETIDRFKVNAMVHGHAHRGRYEGRTPGGQPVYNVARHIEKPTGKPYAIRSSRSPARPTHVNVCHDGGFAIARSGSVGLPGR